MRNFSAGPRRALGAAFVALMASAAPLAVAAQDRAAMADDGKPVLGTVRASTFKCRGGGELTAHFDTQNAELVAIVDAGDGPHILPLRPWASGEGPNVTWSDGRRTLIWTPGVHLQFSDGAAANRGCSRGGEHSH